MWTQKDDISFLYIVINIVLCWFLWLN